MQRDIELWKKPNGPAKDERRIVKCNLSFLVTTDSLRQAVSGSAQMF